MAARFDELADEIMPRQVEVVHIADELLLRIVLAEGGLVPLIYRRVASHVSAAADGGAAAVMFTCSSISPCAEAASLMVDIPVLKIDEPMVDKALSLGTRIGVAATVPTTLHPTTGLVITRATVLGVDATVHAHLCEGAFEALSRGDTETHDCIVVGGLRDLMSCSDVVVLAQASMARVADSLPAGEISVPVLTSPRLAMEHARDVLT